MKAKSVQVKGKERSQIGDDGIEKKKKPPTKKKGGLTNDFKLF